ASRRTSDEDVEKFLTQGIAHALFLAARIVCGYPGINANACFNGSGPQARVIKSPCISQPPHGTKEFVPGVSALGRPLMCGMRRLSSRPFNIAFSSRVDSVKALSRNANRRRAA